MLCKLCELSWLIFLNFHNIICRDYWTLLHHLRFTLLHTWIILLSQEIQTALEQFSRYSIIWDRQRETELVDFMKSKPDLSDFEQKIKYFRGLQELFMAETESFSVGPIAIYTGANISTALKHLWCVLNYFNRKLWKSNIEGYINILVIENNYFLHVLALSKF